VLVYNNMFRVQLGGRYRVGLRSKLQERYKKEDWHLDPSKQDRD
jgi:hypothetical protein